MHIIYDLWTQHFLTKKINRVDVLSVLCKLSKFAELSRCMTHALRQNCGSFLSDSISRDWLSDEERQVLEVGSLTSKTTRPTDSAMNGIEESVSALPAQWPLFDSPALSSIRVTGFVEKNGLTVSNVCIWLAEIISKM